MAREPSSSSPARGRSLAERQLARRERERDWRARGWDRFIENGLRMALARSGTVTSLGLA